MDLELRVRGPVVEAHIAGNFVGSYHTVDGSAIEGHVGFGTAQGSAVLSPPVLTRLDRERPKYLDVVNGVGPPFQELWNQPVLFGDQPGRFPNGGVVFWVPLDSKSEALSKEGEEPEDVAAKTLDRARKAALKILLAMSRQGIAQPLIVMLPAALQDRVDVARWEAELREDAPEAGLPPRLGFHGVVDPPDRRVGDSDDEESGRFDAIDNGRRWLVFVDPYGVARVVQPYTGASVITGNELLHWLTVFKEHGAPDRALPPFSRETEEEDEEDED